jgi:hypothetical protein
MNIRAADAAAFHLNNDIIIRILQFALLNRDLFFALCHAGMRHYAVHMFFLFRVNNAYSTASQPPST